MEIEEKYQSSIQAGETAYNDSEGNLEHALHEALKHYTRPTPPLSGSVSDTPKRESGEIPKGSAVKIIRNLVPDDGKEGSFYRDGHAWTRNRDGSEYRNIDLAPNCHRKWLMEKLLWDELIAGLCYNDIGGEQP